MTPRELMRFLPKIDFSGGLDGCWIWEGSKNWCGYGTFWKNRKAHRVAYEHRYGSVPSGLCLDHVCRNRACVRPSHLRAVTMKVNALSGEGITAVNAKKQYCCAGHELAGHNLKIRRGGRECRECANSRKRGYRAAVRETSEA